jgi:hypothetical protein
MRLRGSAIPFLNQETLKKKFPRQRVGTRGKFSLCVDHLILSNTPSNSCFPFSPPSFARFYLFNLAYFQTRVRDNKFIQFNGLKSVFILKIAKFDLNANFKFITH